MKYDLIEENNKGVIVLMVGDTQNTFGYENNKELFEMLKRFYNGKECIDVYDFEDKFIYCIFNEKDIEDLKKELGVI